MLKKDQDTALVKAKLSTICILIFFYQPTAGSLYQRMGALTKYCKQNKASKTKQAKQSKPNKQAKQSKPNGASQTVQVKQSK